MFYFGVDYYPEHWPESRWPIDARLMQEAGFNVVRLAEFAWSRLEPRAGEFDFAWLDRAIDLLARHGMQIVLGTPTASPPPWVMQRQPELFRVRADGMRVTYGNRRTYCPTNENYHALSRRIVAAMAEHYRDHPAVIGWQIDNEFGERCFCPSCQRAFQAWLRSRYESLTAVNERWGTVFWSHVYGDWDEIPVPVATGASPNPGLALDYARFCSDAYVRYQQIQFDILRAACPHHLITHNFMGFGYDQIDYFDLARPLDFVSWDNYPRMQWAFSPAPDPSRLALSHATMRGLKQKNFWVMEQQAGQGGWEWLSVAPRPGELRLWAYQAIAHGADGILFFRWRTAQVGAEQYWHGLLDHDGAPSRRYAEIKAMGREIAAIGDELAGAEVKAEVAMVLSYESRFAFQIQANNPAFSYGDHFLALYRAFHRHNVSVDVVPPTADLTGYKLVVAPALHVVTEAEAARLRDYVAGGGVLAVTQRSGVKDEANRVVGCPLPGQLAALCGVEVEEYDSLAPGMANGVRFLLPAFGGAADAAVGVLCDILRPTTATAAAEYVADYYAGKPAVTMNRFGKGQAVYLGAVGSAEFYATVAPWLLTLAAVAAGPATAEGVEVCVRRQSDRKVLFALNHTDQPQTLDLATPHHNLLDAEAPVAAITLAPKDLAILAPTTPAPNDTLGTTAHWTAAVRAREHLRGDRLLDDPWAAALAGKEGEEWIAQRPADSTVPIVLRTRFFDDFLQCIAVQNGIRQIVLMAAGLDTRAFRLGWPAQTRLFELDRSPVLDHKQRVLRAAGAQPACARQTVEVDLTGPWQDRIIEAGFDPGQPSGWLLEGFLFYLTSANLTRLLDEVARLAAPGSWLGCDVVNSTMLTSPLTRPWIEMQARAGAPWIGTMDDPEGFLAARGWKAALSQSGQADANFGRWAYPVIPTTMPDMPHNWFVTAVKELLE